jgi:hypothetical protein
MKRRKKRRKKRSRAKSAFDGLTGRRLDFKSRRRRLLASDVSFVYLGALGG